MRCHYCDALEWVEEFEDLSEVVRIESNMLDLDITQMNDALEKLKRILNEIDSGNKNDRFRDVMQVFYDESVRKVRDLKQGWIDAMNDIQSLAVYFGEKVNVSVFTTEKFFGVFDDFRNEFMEHRNKIIGMEERRERQLKIEAKKLKRLQELQQAKKANLEAKKRRKMRLSKRKDV